MKTSNEILKSLNITTEELLKDPEGKLELAIRAGMEEGIKASAENACMINETTGTTDIAEVKSDLGLYHIDKQSVLKLIDQIK